MSLHTDLFAGGATTQLMALFGDADRVVYEARDADPVELRAIVGALTNREEEAGSRTLSGQHRTVKFLRDPASEYGGVAAPQMSDVLVFDGYDWIVKELTALGDTWAVVTVQRTGRREHGRPGLLGGGV